MKKSVRRAAAATTVSLAMAIPMFALPSAVGAAQAGPRADEVVNHGMKADAAGARLIVNNVEVLSLNDSNAPLTCTRRIGRNNEHTGTLATPDGSPIQLGAATNRTVSYREGKQVGVRATSILAPLQVGDSTGQLTGGIPTPEIVIEGMTTVADAFHKAGVYGHQEQISQLDLSIDLLPGQDADQPLQDLLDAIETEVLDNVIEVLQTTVGAAPIEVPGLGSIALGRMRGTTGAHGAESHASALHIKVDATDETHKLILGDTHARIGGPARSVVFGSTSMPMRVDVADGVLRLGHVEPRPMPCEGTRGEERVKKLNKASVLLPEGLIAGIQGISYRSMGLQRKNGFARGYQVSSIAAFTIPGLDLSIEGISSRAEAVKKAGSRDVRSSAKVTVAKIMYQGEEIAVPKPGKPRIIDGLGVIEKRVLTDGGRNGQRVTALRLTLTELGPTTFDLGITGMRIFHS